MMSKGEPMTTRKSILVTMSPKDIGIESRVPTTGHLMTVATVKV